jgi:uncharacterized membrane protein
LGGALNSTHTREAFFAFSSFVMRALARLPPAQGIRAMNSINVLAVTPVFIYRTLRHGVVAVLASSSLPPAGV